MRAFSDVAVCICLRALKKDQIHDTSWKVYITSMGYNKLYGCDMVQRIQQSNVDPLSPLGWTLDSESFQAHCNIITNHLQNRYPPPLSRSWVPLLWSLLGHLNASILRSGSKAKYFGDSRNHSLQDPYILHIIYHIINTMYYNWP